MAEENLDLGEEKKSKPLMLYVGIGVGVVAVVVAILFFGKIGPFAENSGDEGVQGEEAKVDEDSNSASQEALYTALKPDFTISFGNDSPVRMMQLSVSVLTHDPAVVSAIELHMPMIQNNLLMLLSGVDTAKVQTNAGKEEVREAILEEVKNVVKRNANLDGVEQVFFTKFLTQ